LLKISISTTEREPLEQPLARVLLEGVERRV
jgi:hypothetical protein